MVKCDGRRAKWQRHSSKHKICQGRNLGQIQRPLVAYDIGYNGLHSLQDTAYTVAAYTVVGKVQALSGCKDLPMSQAGPLHTTPCNGGLFRRAHAPLPSKQQHTGPWAHTGSAVTRVTPDGCTLSTMRRCPSMCRTASSYCCCWACRCASFRMAHSGMPISSSCAACREHRAAKISVGRGCCSCQNCQQRSVAGDRPAVMHVMRHQQLSQRLSTRRGAVIQSAVPPSAPVYQ